MRMRRVEKRREKVKRNNQLFFLFVTKMEIGSMGGILFLSGFCKLMEEKYILFKAFGKVSREICGGVRRWR